MSSAFQLRAGNAGPVFDGNTGDVLTKQADGKAKFASPSSIPGDHKVAVTVNDTPDYLIQKLAADEGVVIELLNPGADETVQLGLATNPSNPAELNNGNLAAGAQSINIVPTPAQRFTLTGNVTLTIGGLLAARAQWFQLKVIQGGAGSNTLSIVGAKTPGAAGLLLSTTVGAQDLISCYWDGTTLYCQVAGLAFA